MRPLGTSLAMLLLFGVSPALRAGDPGAEIVRASRSLQAMFGDSVAVARTTHILTSVEKQAIWDASRTRWQHDTIRIFRCSGNAGGRTVGYGFLDDVKGKLQYITMLVGISVDGKVKDVDILEYRESYGGEVANESFRKQFRGLGAEAQIAPGTTIKNISGATISARSVTYGVKRIVATCKVLEGVLNR